MARKVRTTFVAVLALIISLACFFHQLFPQPPLLISVVDVLSPPFTLPPNNPIISQEEVRAEEKPSDAKNSTVVFKGGDEEEEKPITRHLISTVSVLLPDWEIVVIVSPVPMDYNTGEYTCLFPNNDASPAKPSGILPFPYRATFRCDLPVSVRHRRLPFPQPILIKSSENPPERKTPATELLRWNFLVYDSFSTEKDVILFVKGLNNRQGVNRLPKEFRCVFSGGDDDALNGIRTAVTTSIQEVFRCPHPDLSAVSSSDDDKPIKISLETPDRNLVVPSVAYYSPPDKVAPDQPKSLLCACTMVYNAAKFLKEWVVYHAGIGIEKFMLYDNGSDDDLERVVGELVQQGYNVTTSFWMWPKTQEAGFSHCAIKAKDSCTWIAYIDVDEFVYSPSWINFSNPSNEMLKSLLPKKQPLHGTRTGGGVGQLMINCYEFGPSNQTSHPVSGVMQGYNCRRKEENRHKSIVLLDAIDESLLNVIHHFKLKHGYKVKKLDSRTAVVNHYKYQAWSEFKTKFRRRVSAYVVDWKVDMNLESKDRTPGLGYEAVEPQGWPQSFCEVHDNRLKKLTRRWFGVESQSGNLMHMAWQIYMKKTYRKT